MKMGWGRRPHQSLRRQLPLGGEAWGCFTVIFCDQFTWKSRKNGLNTKDFYYELPPELIAQTPAAVRDQSRLLVYHKDTGSI